MKRLFNELEFDNNELHNNKKICNDHFNSNNNVNPLNDPVTVIDRHIYFVGTVDEKSISKLVKTIQTLNKEYIDSLDNKPLNSKKTSNFTCKVKPKPLYLHITSFGGSLLAVMSAIDANKKSEIPIYTIVDGYAASAGTLMSVCGKKKYMTKNSYMLIHQLSGGVFGQMQKIEDNYLNCKSFMERIKKIYLEHTKLTDEILDSQLKHDNWWDSSTCLKYGLIDDIY